ncbi:MAG TPA: FliM/FliN family flagellar motor switch protein [Candidatus Hydrogenedentes bacterium]|nr:FliM/FliN family flagellar motor switch protein [Candidatus Hydrogenedentota bacterium]
MSPAQSTPRNESPDPARDEELVPVQATGESLDINDLRPVKLNVSADLGTCPLLVREVLELKRGSVLPLNKLAGEMADISVNGIPMARGEVVVLGDSLSIRIAEIFGAGEKEGGGYE